MIQPGIDDVREQPDAEPTFNGVTLGQAMNAAIALDTLAMFIHGWAVSKGWWKDPNRSFAEQVTNFHAELSEAWEEFRSHGMDPAYFNYRKEDDQRVVLPKPEGISVELMDAIVRILDTCGRYGMNAGHDFGEKLAYNCTRPYRHGGKHA